jgi:hypothetical protein
MHYMVVRCLPYLKKLAGIMIITTITLLPNEIITVD